MKQLINRFSKFTSILFVFILGLTPLVWFYKRNGILITGSDTNFPLNPLLWFNRRFYVWNSLPNTGSDFSSSTAGIFFHLIQTIPYKLGLSLQKVELVSLVFWFLLILFSAFVLARIIFSKKTFPQIIFVALYSFNIYLFNTWENVKVANLSLIAAIPLAVSIFILLKNGKISRSRSFIYSLVVGIILSGSGINPAYFICFFIVLLLLYVSVLVVDVNKKNFIARSLDLLMIVFAIVLVNLFWILPTADFISKNISTSGSIDKIGYNNWIDSLSENTSILNILRLQGAWDWYSFDAITKMPLYIPYSLSYFYRLPFLLFSFLLPLLSFCSLLVVERKTKINYLYLWFLVMLVIGVFLGVGTHLPTGSIYRFISIHLPFFTLFRSPWYIFTPLVTLTFAGLIALLFSNLDSKFRHQRLAVSAVGTLLILGNFLYTYPLVTGKIFRPASHDNFYIKFPRYVFDAGSWLASDKTGRIIGYPDGEIERFGWGYNGIESIMNLISDKETLFPSLNSPNSPVSQLITQFYLSLKRNQIDSLINIAQILNINEIFYKGDQETLSPPLPSEVSQKLIKTFGDWKFYNLVPNSDLQPKIYLTKNVFLSDINIGVLGIAGKGNVFVNKEDSVIGQFNGGLNLNEVVYVPSSHINDLNKVRYVPSTLSDRLIDRNLSSVNFEWDVKSEGAYQPILERYKLEDFGLLAKNELNLYLDGQVTTWKVDKITDSYIYFSSVYLSSGRHEIKVDLGNYNLIRGGDFEKENNFTKKGVGDFSIVLDGNNHYLSMVNKSGKDISANFRVNNFDSLSQYMFKVRYKQVYGDNAALLIGQASNRSLIKSQTERLPNYPEWGIFSFYYEPVQTESNMEIALLAPYTKDALGTKVLYDNLEVYKLFTNSLIFIKSGSGVSFPHQVKSEFRKISPVEYSGSVDGVVGPNIIVFSENYSPLWKIFITDDNGKPIQSTKAFHFMGNFYANSWYIGNVPNHFKFKIYYTRQDLFNLGGFLFFVALGSSLILVVVKIKKYGSF